MEAVNTEKIGGLTETRGKQFNLQVIKGPCFQGRHIMAKSIQECYLTCTITRKIKIRYLIEYTFSFLFGGPLSKRQAVLAKGLRKGRAYIL